MKFLYSHRTKSADGQYVHIRELTDALRARGNDIIMAGPGEGGARAVKNLDAGGGTGLSGILPRPLYECAEYGYSIPAFQKLAKLGSALRPDVLYERYNLYFHAGVWAKKKFNLPFILEVNAPLAEERARHGDLALKSWARRSEKAIWRAADAILPVTNVLADRLRAVGVDEDRITVIQNGVGNEFLRDVDSAPVRARYGLGGKIVLGFTGFVRDWHGVDKVVSFLASRRTSNLHLLLVGDGPARASLERQAHDLGVSDKLTITGVVQREEIPAHVAAFDIALQPAVVDYASPLKLFEYMALGKAILAPASANIMEVLTEDREAILFAADEGAFEQGLGALVDDASLRQRLGEGARASLLRQGLTWAGNAERVEAIAQKLLERQS